MPKKILLAEDEKPMSRAMQLKLKNAGYVVTPAYDGLEAIAALKKDKYDLVLLDLVMPDLDGFGVLTEMKSQKISVPVVVLSNLGQTEDLKKAKELGARDYFIKADVSLASIVEYIKKNIK